MRIIICEKHLDTSLAHSKLLANGSYFCVSNGIIMSASSMSAWNKCHFNSCSLCELALSCSKHVFCFSILYLFPAILKDMLFPLFLLLSALLLFP